MGSPCHLFSLVYDTGRKALLHDNIHAACAAITLTTLRRMRSSIWRHIHMCVSNKTGIGLKPLRCSTRYVWVCRLANILPQLAKLQCCPINESSLKTWDSFITCFSPTFLTLKNKRRLMRSPVCLSPPLTLLGNGSVNMFPRQQIHRQQYKNCWTQ
jgi:hypothetical protein